MQEHEVTTLWQAAFGEGASGNELEKRAQLHLLTALENFSERVAALLVSIPESCRGLTIHDISHVNQLWTVASEICGPHYQINPLEGFVLGAAFLIHDAGLTAAAYPGGVAALKDSTYYRDRVAALFRLGQGTAPSPEQLANPQDEVSERALFDTLRAIHAARAETLLSNVDSHPITKQPYPLFPEPDLFFDCGDLIGLIAASHHWPISHVDTVFIEPRSAPAAFPRWPVDAIKLACILRAADACAIDERRARIMPFLLAKPHGLSRQHWEFQANLNPGTRRDDAITFQSKWPFVRDMAPAWWVAYEAISVADTELRDCDRILRARAASGRHPTVSPFAARRVDGAKDPDRLKQLIQVSGWSPVDTSVRIQNPIRLIEKLGGKQLYGDDYAAPLRELIQNAADAIRARRTRLGGYRDPNRGGRIDISISQPLRDGSYTLSVADDGVGMTEDILTGPLLDFGNSLWASEEAAIKFPGLTSNPNFKPTGQFGIGFYSIFMIASEVKIITRPWDDGRRSMKVLNFQSGLQGRAELRTYDELVDGPVSFGASTLIQAKIDKPRWLGRYAGLSARSEEYNVDGEKIFWELVTRTTRQLLFALDVECHLSVNGKDPFAVNAPAALTASNEHFASIFNEVFGTAEAESRFSDADIPHIESITTGAGSVIARGAVDAEGKHGHIHIGGFTVFRQINGLFKGVIEYSPGTASRLGGRPLATADQISEWGKTQLQHIDFSGEDSRFKAAKIGNLASANVDISRIAMLRVNGEFRVIEEFVHSLKDSNRLFISVRNALGPWPTSLSEFNGLSIWSLADLDNRNFDFYLGNPNYGRSDKYNSILGELENPERKNTAYDILINCLRSSGYNLEITSPSLEIVGTYIGPEGGHGRLLDRQLKVGTDLKALGLTIKCSRGY